MTGPTADQIRELLAGFPAPGGGTLGSAGLVDSVEARDGLVHVALRASRGDTAAMGAVRERVQARLGALAGVANATVVLTAHRPAPAPPEGRTAGAPKPPLLPGVQHVVAVASGKGGVGKSTLAVNLAVSLARQGRRVGLLDADIYGPSLPRMLGVSGKPELRGNRMVPVEAWGVKALSIGLLVDPDQAMIWRGPMVMGALEQMMGQAEWGELDIMVVDMPPGTGDAQLTMAQRVGLAGAVIVSTPQDLALIDARRAIRMFEKTLVPVLGLVENMSSFHCPACGHETALFGHGGARREADALGLPFLGEVPLLLDVRVTGDAGTPVAASAPDSPAALAIAAIAERVWAQLVGRRAGAPRIVVE